MNYRELTEQELFNITWNGAKSNGFTRSVTDEGDCMYDGGNGLKCAAGWHIPEGYDLSDCNSSVASEVPFFIKNYEASQIDFLTDLQHAHDNINTATEYETMLRNVASVHGLVIPE